MRKKLTLIIIVLIIFCAPVSFGQFTHADTLRGSYGSARSWWDVTKYDLHVKFNLEDSSIIGWNEITFKLLKKNYILQIDLQEPMHVDSVMFRELTLEKENGIYWEKPIKMSDVRKDGNAYFISLPKEWLKINQEKNLIIYYHGKPRIAKKPPWDGGIIWKKDHNGNPWMSVACQGLGASVWYPCKDHQSDEPDSAELHITAPSELVSLGNGRMRNKVNNNDGTTTYSWAIVNPINNYNIIPYIGKYVNFNEVYKGENGNLDMNYWVLDYNIEIAKKHFTDAPKMMKAFEHWFGPYPFYEDGYKLVEAPYLGMEHQSAVAYGNGYLNGYLGRDLSGTGWGMKWDFIIVHESGHEWFANNITSKDIADMWVHEGFTNYSETLFIDYYYGKKAGNEYVIGTRKKISNDIPIIGSYGVNNEGSTDMYYKGGNMLHTIRQIINNDEKFRTILRGLNKTFYHQTVTSSQIENYINKNSGKDFSKVFDQYLRTTLVPTLEYKIEKGDLFYRWTNVVKGFNIPLKIFFKHEQWLTPLEQWKTLSTYPDGEINFSVDKNFYIKVKKLE